MRPGQPHGPPRGSPGEQLADARSAPVCRRNVAPTARTIDGDVRVASRLKVSAGQPQHAVSDSESSRAAHAIGPRTPAAETRGSIPAHSDTSLTSTYDGCDHRSRLREPGWRGNRGYPSVSSAQQPRIPAIRGETTPHFGEGPPSRSCGSQHLLALTHGAWTACSGCGSRCQVQEGDDDRWVLAEGSGMSPIVSVTYVGGHSAAER